MILIQSEFACSTSTSIYSRHSFIIRTDMKIHNLYWWSRHPKFIFVAIPYWSAPTSSMLSKWHWFVACNSLELNSFHFLNLRIRIVNRPDEISEFILFQHSLGNCCCRAAPIDVASFVFWQKLCPQLRCEVVYCVSE